MALRVVPAPQPPMTTNVDAVYVPDLSTRSALPPFRGRLAADFPCAAPAITLAPTTVIFSLSGSLGERNGEGS